ncbi:MAG: helix-turn-helix domain-containing protein [Clostridia bacterium]
MNRLKFLREERGLYQSDIAKILGISTSAVGFYENEKRDMSPEVIIKLADYFDVTTDYLLGKTNKRNYDKDEQEFRFAYHKEMEGLTDEEIADALRFYKEMKKKVKGDK